MEKKDLTSIAVPQKQTEICNRPQVTPAGGFISITVLINSKKKSRIKLRILWFKKIRKQKTRICNDFGQDGIRDGRSPNPLVEHKHVAEAHSYIW